MSTFTKITFNHPINPSLQVGDIAYVSDIDALSGIMSEPVYVQKINLVNHAGGFIWIDKPPTVPPIITSTQYILFSKPIEVEESSLKGYYADVTFENSSNKKTELFAISSEVVPSSK